MPYRKFLFRRCLLKANQGPKFFIGFSQPLGAVDGSLKLFLVRQQAELSDLAQQMFVMLNGVVCIACYFVQRQN
jgi:hypothetical protein